VTLPRPDLPIVLLSHRGPVSFGRDESGRTASRGAGGLVTALIGADAGPSRRRLGMRAATDEDPAVVGEHDHQVFSATLEQPEPAASTRPSPPLRSASFPVFGCAWSRSTARPHDNVYTVIVNPSGRPAGRAWGAECAGAAGRTAGRDARCPCHQPRLGREELMALGAFATLTAELVRTAWSWSVGTSRWRSCGRH
jgi:hypothetical protein